MNVQAQVKKAPFWLKALMVMACGVMFAPLAFLALKGLFAIGVTLALVALGIYGGPVAAEKLANMRHKGLVNEWKENPIPTLQRQYAEKVEKLAESRGALQTFIAKVSNYAARVRNYKSQFPRNKEKHKLYDDQLSKFQDLQQLKEGKYKQTETAVQRFGEVVVEAEAEWEMAMAAADVNKASDFNNDPMELLKARTALDSVQTAMNSAFAELEIALLEEPRFDNNVIDIQEVPVQISHKEAVPIRK